MPKKRSKRYLKAAALVTPDQEYSLEDAAGLVKQFPAPKFDQTVTLSFKMGVDLRQPDQKIRGTCLLPHGSGKEVRVLVFAKGEAAEAAKNAGAEMVGFDDLLKKVQGGFTDFDVAVATPDAMAEVRKLSRVLGPRGLMPNPKTGTVTDDTAGAVQAVKAGRVDFKLDRKGNISVPIGRAGFEEKQLSENGAAVIDAIKRAKPAAAKGRYIESATMSGTMTPGVPLQGSLYTIV